MRAQAWFLRGRRAVLALPALCLGSAAWAASVQVDVQDAAGQPLGGAVVFLESAEARRLVKPLAEQEMSQENKQFVPEVRVLTVGTELRFPNRDTVRHHVYSFSPVKKFEIKLYVGTPAAPVVFDKPGIAVLGCNIHDTMAAWMVVVETPHHGLTTDKGQLRLASVPAGAYRLRTWHPGLPPGAPALDQPLQVPATGNVAASVKLTGVAP